MRLKVTSLVIFVLQLSLPFLHAQKSTYTKDVLRYVQGEVLRVIGSFNDTLHVMGINKNEVTIHLFSANMDGIASRKIATTIENSPRDVFILNTMNRLFASALVAAGFKRNRIEKTE
jgi:ABC-type uncharacterized transport system substrate-binding protein